MLPFGLGLACLVAVVLLIAWASDRRDRRAGRSFRSGAEIGSSARQARRTARWRREQLGREAFPQRPLDKGD